MPEPAQLRGYPLLRLGVEGNGKLKQKCQRGSEFRCAPAVPAFVGRLVRPAPAVADEPPRYGRTATGQARGCLHCGGQRFESPPLHQEVRANRRDFPGSEITPDFRNPCVENRSLRPVWHVQATFLDASRLKSLAANFRFQGCCLRVRRAGFGTALGDSNLDI
jgi:hypothetical protein